jgi:hypothetical protein
MENGIFFDTDKLATELRISRDDFNSLKTSVREEFPDDEMMYQLHLLRALHRKSMKSLNIVTKRRQHLRTTSGSILIHQSSAD